MTYDKPLRILHVVGGMGQGGVETWLLHVLRSIDRERFHLDFLVHTDQPQAYDEEVRSLGAEIISCPKPSSQPWAYARHFKRALRERKPYDIIHSHVHHFSGFILRLARQEKIPTRISHSHTDLSQVVEKAGISRRMYVKVMKRWIDKNSTVGLAASRKAASCLFGRTWEGDPRWNILYYGIDLESFKVTFDSSTVRAELGIPVDAFVVGHVGGIREVKNHAFLVRVMAKIAEREQDTRLLLVGDGPLRSSIEQQVESLGIAERVIFAGLRSDIPRLMLGAMDVFVLPSSHEGLPLVGIEAQAAGLPIILSDTVTEEMDVAHWLIRRLSLSQPASVWAEATMAAHADVGNGNRPNALALLENSRFHIRQAVKELEDFYLKVTPACNWSRGQGS